ncbi:Dps family protein [Microbacterium dextranolyticum]|uniref:DNA starvation/stationary phase protection protein n=1 Tax=Microbacterium dextranolyticum TaxID=36806 RepID=A0A9W6HNK8_9MICO|nr:DNA starvation/stationary phase protection protein [Microbacterium dextranolyticum]MBM7462846.1 starvation-inducible DNA-binding protein [Microbacterium dextranolyticum]GLJ96049.1 DNA starvation/stationary phase protection protein [Microbacterium dextranolyticum]
MTETKTISMTAAGPEASAGTAQFLTPVVLGLQALAVNGKQAHWNVRGTNFIAIHELLDQVVANAQGFADLAAERIVALGLPIDARVSTVAEKAAPTTVPAGFTPWDEIVRAVVTDMDVVIADVQAAIDGLDETDLTSQDVAIAIKAGLEKDRWFLSAHLAA